MTINFTEKPSSNGAEPNELLLPLALEYLTELARRKLVELFEKEGKDGVPTLIVVIPNVRVEDNKIVPCKGEK